MKGEYTQNGKEAMERFKMECASEMGVNLKQGYNGDLTARQAGSVGGQMVNMMCPELQWKFRRNNMKVLHHYQIITYTLQAGV